MIGPNLKTFAFDITVIHPAHSSMIYIVLNLHSSHRGSMYTTVGTQQSNFFKRLTSMLLCLLQTLVFPNNCPQTIFKWHVRPALHLKDLNLPYMDATLIPNAPSVNLLRMTIPSTSMLLLVLDVSRKNPTNILGTLVNTKCQSFLLRSLKQYL